MKPVASLLLAVLLLLSLTACGQEAPQAPATLGQALLQDFQTRIKDSPQADLETLAQGLLDQEDLEFQGAVTPVEPGLLMGFGNETIQGFSQGVMFAPVISTIPFVGYLFRLRSRPAGRTSYRPSATPRTPGGISAPRPMRRWSSRRGTSSSS